MDNKKRVFLILLVSLPIVLFVGFFVYRITKNNIPGNNKTAQQTEITQTVSDKHLSDIEKARMAQNGGRGVAPLTEEEVKKQLSELEAAKSGEQTMSSEDEAKKQLEELEALRTQ